MTLQAIQAQVQAFVDEHDLATSPETRLLDLISEVGELSKEVLQANDYGKSLLNLDDERHASWAAEMGDVLFALVCLANATGVDLDQALTSVLDKYKQRLADRGDAGSGG